MFRAGGQEGEGRWWSVGMVMAAVGRGGCQPQLVISCRGRGKRNMGGGKNRGRV